MHREERRYMVSSIASLLRLGWLESCQKPTMPVENANVSLIRCGRDCRGALLLRSTSHYDSEKPCQFLSVSAASKNPLTFVLTLFQVGTETGQAQCQLCADPFCEDRDLHWMDQRCQSGQLCN